MVGALVMMGLAVTVGAAVELARLRSFGSALQDAADGAALHAAKVAVKGGADGTVEAAARTFLLAHAAADGVEPTVATTVMSRAPVRVSSPCPRAAATPPPRERAAAGPRIGSEAPA